MIRPGDERTKHADGDTVSEASNAHPTGTAAGAAAGAVAGAVVGAPAGPAGAGLGAAIGAVAGALGGIAVAEIFNPTVEDAFWRENYLTTVQVDPEKPYEYYQPAYRFGWESLSRYGRRSFAEVDDALEAEWEKERNESYPRWPEARAAARDAWDRAARHEWPKPAEPAEDPDRRR